MSLSCHERSAAFQRVPGLTGLGNDLSSGRTPFLSRQQDLPPRGRAPALAGLSHLEGYFPKFLPLSCLRIWDENNTQSLCNPSPRNRIPGGWPCCFPLQWGMLSDGYRGGKPLRSHYSLTTQLSGNEAGKSLTVLTAQTDRAIRVEQVMGGVQLVAAKSMQGMQHSDLGGGGGQPAEPGRKYPGSGMLQQTRCWRVSTSPDI